MVHHYALPTGHTRTLSRPLCGRTMGLRSMRDHATPMPGPPENEDGNDQPRRDPRSSSPADKRHWMIAKAAAQQQCTSPHVSTSRTSYLARWPRTQKSVTPHQQGHAYPPPARVWCFPWTWSTSCCDSYVTAGMSRGISPMKRLPHSGVQLHGELAATSAAPSAPIASAKQSLPR